MIDLTIWLISYSIIITVTLIVTVAVDYKIQKGLTKTLTDFRNYSAALTKRFYLNGNEIDFVEIQQRLYGINQHGN
jgi:hypothetical protein